MNSFPPPNEVGLQVRRPAAASASSNRLSSLFRATLGKRGLPVGPTKRAIGGERGAAVRKKWILRHLLSLLWPTGAVGLKVRVVGGALLVVGGKLAIVAAPLLYKQIIDTLSIGELAFVPIALIVAYAIAQVGSQLIGALRKLLFLPVAQRAIRLTALKAFQHLHSLSLRFHLDRKTGGVSHVVQRGTTSIEYLLELVLFNVMPTLLELALVSAILWRFYSGEFALAVAGTILAYAAFTALITRRQMHYRQEMNRLDVAASVKATDSLLNYETVKYFAAEVIEAEHYDEARRAHEQAALRNGIIESLFAAGQAAIIAIGLVAVMLMAAAGVTQGRMTIGDFVLVGSYLLQLCVPLGMLGSVYFGAKQSLNDVAAMSQLLGRSAEVADRADAAPLDVSRAHVRFDRVGFSYDSRRPVLLDLSFEIPGCATVALVGASGAGKSSIARLLFRFYDVEEGAITIDGQDVRTVTQESLRAAIGVVPQDTVLFNDTIAYNIGYGRPGATRAEIEEAARRAHIHDFIRSMPNGYETEVGERGLKLSGGEKQRVAIARVILKDPALLIFDEATSALDSRTEGDIQASLSEISAQRSTLVIAHRLSTVVDADEILVLDQGRIVERGRHEDLLARDLVYAAMWRRQHRAGRSPD